MEHKLTSEGKCLFCSQLVSQAQITKHLAAHLAKIEKEDAAKSPETYCHIVVDDGAIFL